MNILMIGSSLSITGGVQRYMIGLLGAMDTDRYRVDVLVSAPTRGDAEGEALLRATGIREMYLLPPQDRDRLAFLPGFLRAHRDYDIVHLHTASKANALACVLIRLFCPRAKLIVHAHTVYPPVTLSWHAAHVLYQCTAHWFLGCGVAAGRFLFGHAIDRRKNFSVACNAVDKTRFFPDAAAGAALRAAFGLGAEQPLMGFVGRYNHEKNILFVLDIFNEIYKTDKNWRLLLVGGGDDQAKVDAKINALNLGDAVLQAGVRQDIPAFMNAFDIFMLPSEFEGSPVTLVEAQACGTPCLISTNVPGDGAVTDLVRALPLTDPPARWAAAARQMAVGGPHADRWPQLTAAGYAQQTAARRMEELYERLVGGRA